MRLLNELFMVSYCADCGLNREREGQDDGYSPSGG